jgi:hypothetical protein
MNGTGNGTHRELEQSIGLLCVRTGNKRELEVSRFRMVKTCEIGRSVQKLYDVDLHHVQIRRENIKF